MAKSKKKRDPWPEVLAAVRELKRVHRIGREVLDEYGRSAVAGAIDAEAERRGINPDTLRKLRQFAQLYGKKDLRELCEFCKIHKRALGVSFVYRLVGIESRAARRKFQCDMIQGHWNRARVDLEIRARFPRKHHAGRRFYTPETLDGALAQLDSLCRSLERWREQIESPRKRQEGDPEPITLKDLPAPVLAGLNQVDKAVRGLRQAIADSARNQLLRIS